MLRKILSATQWLGRHRFRGSDHYWQERYATGLDSGVGSYRKFAEFKADVLNGFVKEKGIASVIEHGCGDGNQLGYMNYPSYLGLDVSAAAIERCQRLFAGDARKAFKMTSAYAGDTAELALSLDVIYHLVEDRVFAAYMERLFDSATRFVVIYSPNSNKQQLIQAPHVRYRRFSDWIQTHRPSWKLIEHIPNRYPPLLGLFGSRADFFIYEGP